MKNVFLVMFFLFLCVIPALSSGSSSCEVKKGDTLWDLSEKYYGTGYSWKKIYAVNRGLIKDPDKIYPFQKLIIPDTDVSVNEPVPAAAAHRLCSDRCEKHIRRVNYRICNGLFICTRTQCLRNAQRPI